MTSRIAFLALTLLIPLAACSDDSNDSVNADQTTVTTVAPEETTTTSTSGASSENAVAVASTGLGDVLVSADGMTLYAFTPDSANASTCEGGCAATWPPLADDGVTPGDGLDASKLGTITRGDGTTQVTYGDHPLYHFTGDQAAGDTNGQGTAGKWFVVAPDGSLIQ